MKYPILFFCFPLMFVSCKKEEAARIPTSATHVFFKNRTDMLRQIQSVIDKRYPGDTLREITHVSYIDSRDKSYALVFYKSGKRSGNLLLEQTYKQGVLYAASSASCEGIGCNCQVVTTISNAGNVTVNCSCSSCTMLVTKTATPITH